MNKKEKEKKKFMAMQNNDNSRCNCEKIFSKETLNCCCDKVERNCNCELRDYKCCLKITPLTCCGVRNKNGEKRCDCDSKNKTQVPNDKQSSIQTCPYYNIRRIEATLKCCCEINGKNECCCSKLVDISCCCIITGKDECCCDHSGTNQDKPTLNTVENKNQESVMQSRIIEKTSVPKDSSTHSISSQSGNNSQPVPEAFSNNSSSTRSDKSASNSTQRSIHSGNQSVSNSHDKSTINSTQNSVHIENPTVANIHIINTSSIDSNKKPMNLDNPSILTSTCLASQRNKDDYKSVDEELINELKEFKKSCLSEETYDVYIVNDKGSVNSFELKHFANQDDDQQTYDSNPNEEFLNRQIHGICIKNKQSGLNSTYDGKMKSILDKIKKQNTPDNNKPNEPTILEITEFAPNDKTKTDEIIQNVFKSENATCKCDKPSELCECEIKIEIVGAQDLPPHMNFTDLKTYSQDADALDMEIKKMSTTTVSNKNTLSNNTVNNISVSNSSQIYEHQVDKNDSNKLYYSTHSSSDSESIVLGEEMTTDKHSENVKEELNSKINASIKSPFENDMENKIKDALASQNIRPDSTVEAININIGGRIIAPNENGLEVTSFKMNIQGEDESIDIENETPSDEIIDKIMRNPSVTIRENKTVSSKSFSTIKTAEKELVKGETYDLPPQEKTIAVVNPELLSTKIENVIENLANKNTPEENERKERSVDKSQSTNTSQSVNNNEEQSVDSNASIKNPTSAHVSQSVNSNVSTGAKSAHVSQSTNASQSVNSNVSIGAKSTNALQSALTNKSQSDSSQTTNTTQHENITSLNEDQVKRKQLNNEETIKSTGNSSSKVENNEILPNTEAHDKTFLSNEDLLSQASTVDVIQNDSQLSSENNPKSLVSCHASAKTIGSTVEIALHLTNEEEEKEEEKENEESTITFIEQSTSDLGSTLAQVKRNNKVGKLIEFFEEIEKKNKKEKE